MTILRVALFLFFTFILTGFQKICAFEKQEDGVIFEIRKKAGTEPETIKIQVCTAKIIRVLATPGKSFSARPSLMVEKTTWEKVPFTVSEKDDVTEIVTDKLKITVDRGGAVSFYDKNNHLLLAEKKDSGKKFSPAEVMGEKTFHVQQWFNSPEDEAFYGLGAHQNGVMNYKGHDIDLWQYNIVNAIPFLVSNKNYALLWDNNSRTKFGDIRDYESLSGLKLYDKSGQKGGLSAEYFRDNTFQNRFTERTEQRIEHEFLDVNDAWPEGFQENVAAIRWSGEIECNEPGIQKFRLYCSGYTKMWLDGKLVVDSWRQNWLPWTHLPRLNMETGKRYKIKIEWIHTGGFIGLKYLPPEDKIYQSSLSLYSEVADQIDYYFIYGHNMDQLIKGYRSITGKAPVMPEWAMGLWQCRERYKTQEELLGVVKEFRRREIPLDNIVQDWFYWKEDQWGSHLFDKSRYPDPQGMIRQLHEDLHTHFMISVWPKFYEGTENYEKFRKNGWLYMRNIEKKERDWVGPGYVSTFYDPYSEAAGQLFWDLLNQRLFRLGVDAWWLDATEPDIHSNLSPAELRKRIGPTALGTAARYLNTYSLVNSKSVYEGQRQADPDKRVFILTRSAFAGQQRYSAATWSGDIATRWYDLKIQIPAGLNFSLSGIPYWTADIGGFAVEPRFVDFKNETDREEWRELNTRWFQFCTFCPVFRVHGQYPYREMFNIAPPDHPAYKTMLAYDHLRYRLMPYIYSLAGMVTHDDYTIMRALVMDFAADKYVEKISDQFMFGPAIMVNPVTAYKIRERRVYLPTVTGWYDLNSGKFYKGGQTVTAAAPYENIPLFISAGAILPCGPAIRYTGEKQSDPLRLFVCTGADGRFKLYEDEGINYNYEKGAFSWIPFTFDNKTGVLTIGKREGKFPGMLQNRKFEIVWMTAEQPRALDFHMEPDTTVVYDGAEIQIRMK